MTANTSVYNELRLERELCDAVIKVDNVEFQVHKIILCNCSTYFRTLFTQWSTPQRHIYDILHVSPEIMKTIIEFAYTGIVPVTSENAQELFVVAHRFLVEGITKVCSDFMEQMLEPQNCIGIWRFADFYGLPKVRDKAFVFFLNHFEELAAFEEFLSLSAQELVQVIKRDELRVTKEDKVYEAALRWIDHAPEERRGHLPHLMSNVRLALMSPEYFSKNVAENEMVKANRLCQLIVSDTVDTMLYVRISGSPFSTSGDPLARPRLPPAILFAVGGWSLEGPTNVIEAYDMHVDNWVSVSETEADMRAYHGATYLDGFIYCIGGFSLFSDIFSVTRFDLVTCRWQEVAPMHRRRCYVSVTKMDGYIYALGGYVGITCLESAERYLPSANQWTIIAPMNEKRSAASCASLRGKVYICGGFNGEESLSSAECYNPETDQWTMIAEMSTRRSGVGVIAAANLIFAVGGFNRITRLCTVEVYNPDTDTWHDVAPMQKQRSNFGIELIDDRLFVVGGFDGESTICDSESYDVKTNVWSKVHEMVVTRSAVRCCVASGFPNLAKYATPRPHLQEEVTSNLVVDLDQE